MSLPETLDQLESGLQTLEDRQDARQLIEAHLAAIKGTWPALKVVAFQEHVEQLPVRYLRAYDLDQVERHLSLIQTSREAGGVGVDYCGRSDHTEVVAGHTGVDDLSDRYPPTGTGAAAAAPCACPRLLSRTRSPTGPPMPSMWSMPAARRPPTTRCSRAFESASWPSCPRPELPTEAMGCHNGTLPAPPADTCLTALPYL